MNILLIEDNRDIAENIAEYFEASGHELDFAYSGEAGLQLASDQTFDVIVLDLMLPGMNGYAVCRALRESLGLSTPILFLTARSELEDKLEGFNAGANDYLTKPFSMLELEARLNVLSRVSDSAVSSGGGLRCADLVLDPGAMTCQRGEISITLNKTEFRLLTMLIEASPRVVSREQMIDKIWGDSPPEQDLLRTQVYNLRQKIDKQFEEKLISTVHGVGYRIGASE